MNTTIAICTVGRPAVLHETVERLGTQTRTPRNVLICAADEASVSNLTRNLPNVEVVLAEKRGLTAQRNQCSENLHTPYSLFLDDDVELAPNYIESMEALLGDHPDAIMAAAEMAADGARGDRGYSHIEASEILSGYKPTGQLKPIQSVIGCNFFVRTEIVRSVRFDEHLPLYGWLEDLDFSTRAKVFGNILQNGNTALVHLGVSSGRVSGVRLGYSQIINPIYLWRKSGHPTLGRIILDFWLKLVLSNLVHSIFRSQSHRIDRPGRLHGNILAFRDLFRGCINPDLVRCL